MCGRFATAFPSPEKLTSYFGLDQLLPFPTSYNLAPTRNIPTIRQHHNKRILTEMTWGLIPHWTKERLQGLHTFNARVESLTEKPTFRALFKTQHCIIPASGFYEWQKQGESKQPFYIFRQDREPLALAGLWDHWTDPASGEDIASCTIVTVPANVQMSALHDRMPAILEPEHFAVWLDPQFKETQQLLDILLMKREVLEMSPVTTFVNNSRHDGPECVTPIQS